MEVADRIKTVNKYFPDLRKHNFPRWIEVEGAHFDARDIVSFGVPITVESLTEAYHKGIFPWDVSPYVPLPWYCPRKRAILEFADLKIPRSLRKEWKKMRCTFSIDRKFFQVIRSCQGADRKGQHGPSWITGEFVRGFYELHQAGLAHSVEVWGGEDLGDLVGGLYGVDCGGVFCGESMFHSVSYASKFAVLHLIEHLQERGATWLDIEVMTPHFEMLGAKEIDRSEYLDKLAETQARGLTIF
jgi:leucyl/phenylalanyl-tRNA--protein transferase